MGLFDTGIRPAIDQHLLEEAAKVRDYGDYWSASSAGYCMRRNIFERLGVPHSTPDDPRKQRVFSAGHIFHEWIQGLTKAAGISVAQELELQDEGLMVRGHFDDLVLIKSVDELNEDPTGGTGKYVRNLILYDYKTVNSRSFSWAKKNGSEMSYYHKMQLGTYMYMLRNQPNKIMDIATYAFARDTPATTTENLTEARILKISKDDLRLEEQQLMWSPELEAEVLKYWSKLNEYWTGHGIPPCTCADHENGFLAKEAYNPFFYEDQPCSIKWYEKWKEAQ